jgi:hypothetical protein
MPWNRHALKRDPNTPLPIVYLEVKQACPDKAEHHDLFGSPLKLPKTAFTASLTLSRLSGQSCDGSRENK